MMLSLENSDHSIILFHLPFYRHRHLLVRKIVFSQKALRCTCVLRWGHGWGDTAAGFCWDKEWQRNMCVFRTHPEVLRGQGKGWDGNLDREVGELVWDPEAISLLPGISQCWKLQLERDSALTGTFRFLLHKKFCWMITHFRYYRQKCGRAGYKTDD